MFRRSLLLVVAGLAFAASNASAQAAFDGPQFFSPREMDEIGLYYFKTNFPAGFRDPGGLKLIWRQSGNLHLGIHAGTADLKDIGQAILLGVELYQPLRSLSQSTGLLLNGVVGAGAVFGSGYADASIPVGISAGFRLGSGSTAIIPFVYPRASLDITSFGDAPNEVTKTNLGLAADLGVDVDLGQRLTGRASYSLGDRKAFGVGLALRIPRKVVVR